MAARQQHWPPSRTVFRRPEWSDEEADSRGQKHLGIRGRFWLAMASVALSTCVAFAEDAVVLQRGKAVERELAGGQEHLYRVPIAAGEYAVLWVEQRGIDVVVQILGPDGKSVADFDSEMRPHGREVARLVADAADNYGVRIKARYPRAGAARYEIRLVEVRPSVERDRAAFEVYKLGTEALRLDASGKYDEAIGTAERALDLALKTLAADDPYIARLLVELASVKRRTGDYPTAEQCYLRAIAIDQKAFGREHPETAVDLRGLGMLYLYTNEYAKAEPLLKEALEIVERTLGAEHPAMVTSLSYLSLLHQYREDWQRALSERERAVAIGEKQLAADDITLIAEVSNLGDLYSLVGDNRRAEPMLERALAMLVKKYGPEHPSVAIPMSNLGIIARQNKQYSRALELLWRAEALKEKALGIRSPQTTALLINIGNVYIAQGEYAQALELHQRALEILESAAGPYHKLTLAAIGNVARVYTLQRNIPLALTYQTRYEDVLEKNIAMNLTIGSEREKLAFLNGRSWQTDRVISLDLREAPENAAARELALLVLLQRKGRVLDSVSGAVGAMRLRLNAEDHSLLEELGKTNAELARRALGGPGKTPEDEYRKQLAALEEKKEKYEAAISVHSAEFSAQVQPVTLAAVRAAIPPRAALIEFSTYFPFDPKADEYDPAEPARYVAYVLRGQGEVKARDLGTVKEIDDAVAALRPALGNPRRPDVQELARSLDRKIGQPIRELAGDATQLLISPDGELNLIPFEALADEQGRYMVEHYSIGYLTAGRDLLRKQVARMSRTGPVILADPLFGEPPITASAKAPANHRSVTGGKDLSNVYFARLPGTADEARIIQSLFPEAKILTGREATKASLKRVEAPSILHIATHGFFLDDPPSDQPAASRKLEDPLLRSGLALAGANRIQSGSDDGILTALEASDLNLWGTKVVTLSACETGLGKVRNGEGVYGLRRAFFLAGTETLVMSLWAVSDRVSRETMAAYYMALKQKVGRGEALRQAQLSMLKRKDRQHPYYWAGFIQSGDWTNLEGR
jgi:CHAT domain-containing protein